MMKKLILLISAVCLLLSSCSNYGGEIVIPDPDLIITDDVTEISEFSPIIMPEKDDEKFREYAEVIGEEKCIPGYVYLYHKRLDPTKSKLTILIPQRVDRETGLFQSRGQSENDHSFRYVYCLSEDRTKLIKADKVTGDVSEFTCDGGTIDMVTGTDNVDLPEAEKNDYLFFRAGDNCYIIDGVQGVILQHFESENGISDIKGGYDFAKGRYNKGVSGAYICEECGASGVLWSDNGGQYYWYHPHSGENQPLDFQSIYYPFNASYKFLWRFMMSSLEGYDNFNDFFLEDGYLYAVVSDDGYYGYFDYPSEYNFSFQNFEKAELYVENAETGERKLLLDNIIYACTNENGNIIALVNDTNTLILEVDAKTGYYETKYTAQSGNIKVLKYGENAIYQDGNKIFSFGLKGEEDLLLLDPDDSFEFFHLDACDVMRVNHELLDMNGEKLFDLPNGLSGIYSYPFGMILNSDPADLSYSEYFPFDDFSDAYICDECVQQENYFVWEDENGNCFWYHPHSHEQEEVRIVERKDVAASYATNGTVDIEYVAKK